MYGYLLKRAESSDWLKTLTNTVSIKVSSRERLCLLTICIIHVLVFFKGYYFFIFFCLLFCKFKYFSSKSQEKDVKKLVFSKKNCIFCNFSCNLQQNYGISSRFFVKMHQISELMHFLHVIAHSFECIFASHRNYLTHLSNT